MTSWRSVPRWSLAANDEIGDCTFAALCNLLDLRAALAGHPFTIEEAEAERFYSLVAGFNSQDSSTDRGATLPDALEYWRIHGWPTDPVCRLESWNAITMDDIPEAIEACAGVPCWVMLPCDELGDPDFSDDALSREGIDAHAMLCVEVGPLGYRVVSWGEIYQVSREWMERFGRGWFRVVVAG